MRQWAAAKVEQAEPTLGVAGPILWALAIVVLVIGIYTAFTFNDADLMVPATASLAALLALATAPLWMVRVAVRGHHRRNASVRRDADDLRRHLEAAYVERRVDDQEFAELDDQLDAIRRGRTGSALAATTSRYLRGVAWALLAAGIILAISGAAAGAILYDWATSQGEDPHADGLVRGLWTAGAVAGAAGLGLAILFGLAAHGARLHARALRGQDEALVQETRTRLLALRRG